MKYGEMTKMQRKVAIAKDVIANLQAKKLNVKDENGYITGIDIALYTKEEVQSAIPLLKTRCEVCARGAMVLCKIDKFNGCSNLNIGFFDQDDTTDILKDAFTEYELDIIEAAFEVVTLDYLKDYKDYQVMEKAIDFGSRFSDPEDRLMAIMQNIVDHKGVFKPEVEYEIVKA